MATQVQCKECHGLGCDTRMRAPAYRFAPIVSICRRVGNAEAAAPFPLTATTSSVNGAASAASFLIRSGAPSGKRRLVGGRNFPPSLALTYWTQVRHGGEGGQLSY